MKNDQLWRYAADVKTLTGKQLGVKLTRLGGGAGELDVYFDPAIPVEEKIISSKYVHEHVMQKGQDVVRLRYYVCPHCGAEVGNREVAMKRLTDWLEARPVRGRETRAQQVGRPAHSKGPAHSRETIPARRPCRRRADDDLCRV